MLSFVRFVVCSRNKKGGVDIIYAFASKREFVCSTRCVCGGSHIRIVVAVIWRPHMPHKVLAMDETSAFARLEDKGKSGSRRMHKTLSGLTCAWIRISRSLGRCILCLRQRYLCGHCTRGASGIQCHCTRSPSNALIQHARRAHSKFSTKRKSIGRIGRQASHTHTHTHNQLTNH